MSEPQRKRYWLFGATWAAFGVVIFVAAVAFVVGVLGWDVDVREFSTGLPVLGFWALLPIAAGFIHRSWRVGLAIVVLMVGGCLALFATVWIVFAVSYTPH